MAQPSNTFDSYDAVGLKEIFPHRLHKLVPQDTPFYSKSKKTKASNTLHEWQTDALRSSAANSHIEGDATTAEARTATTRLGNYTNIFKNAVVVPDTDEGTDKHGRNRDLAYHVLKVGVEAKIRHRKK